MGWLGWLGLAYRELTWVVPKPAASFGRGPAVPWGRSQQQRQGRVQTFVYERNHAPIRDSQKIPRPSAAARELWGRSQ